MAFRELNPQHELTGFLARIKANVCTGKVIKHVNKTNGAFFVLELTTKCNVNQQVLDKAGKPTKDKEGKEVVRNVEAKAGQFIGVAAVATLAPLAKLLGREVRLTFEGEKPSEKYKGKMIQLYKIDVEVENDQDFNELTSIPG